MEEDSWSDAGSRDVSSGCVEQVTTGSDTVLWNAGGLTDPVELEDDREAGLVSKTGKYSVIRVDEYLSHTAWSWGRSGATEADIEDSPNRWLAGSPK